jgi:hypothetical protein
MAKPYTKSGKCGNIVWQRARYGQICYAAFIPFNPRTPAQVAVRGIFAAISKRWGTLTQAQCLAWILVARTILSRPRLGCGPLTGFNLFVMVNVRLANRGLPQVDLPPPCPGTPQQAVSSLFRTSPSDQLPISYTLYLEANHLLERWHYDPGKSAVLVPAPT